MASDQPSGLRLLDIVSVAVFAVLAGALGLRLWSVSPQTAQLLPICSGAALGYLIADIVSGVVHWFCDTFFREDTPVIGRAFIHPFREHHIDPLAITRHDFFEVNGSNCLALIPVLAAVLILGEPRPGDSVLSLFGQSTVLSLALATFATNQIHKWAHQPRAAAPVRWLQATGLILSPVHHSQHHTEPYRQSFCITVGWLDPWLDRTRLFERIEHMVRRTAGKAGAASRHLPADRLRQG